MDTLRMYDAQIFRYLTVPVDKNELEERFRLTPIDLEDLNEIIIFQQHFLDDLAVTKHAARHVEKFFPPPEDKEDIVELHRLLLTGYCMEIDEMSGRWRELQEFMVEKSNALKTGKRIKV
ncbi:MAG: hypothetical protein PHF51_03025 [Candidatus ainarchaeum sp.]|nr:hypothetical protein [Candidatus ainarchaeum sp.]